MIHAIEMGWFVLSKYYGLSDATPVYAAAILLHPQKRACYIEKRWDKDWRQPAIDAVRSLWQSNYESLSTEPPPAETHQKGSVRESTILELLEQEMDVVDRAGEDRDDFDSFITAKPIRIACKPLDWWCHPDQRRRFPRLSRMAIDILSIPPMSDEAERVFSGARRTISWERARLSAEMVEITECMAHWIKHRLISSRSSTEIGTIGRAIDTVAVESIKDS